MGLFRSEQMGYFRLIMPKDYAWEVLNEIGELGAIEFIDENPGETHFTKEFAPQLKRCEEVDSNLKLIEHEMVRFNKEITPCEDFKGLLNYFHRKVLNNGKAINKFFEEIEAEVDIKTKQLMEQLKNYEEFIERYSYLLEYKNVLIKSKEILADNSYLGGSKQVAYGTEVEVQQEFITKSLDSHLKGIKLNYLAGVISKEEAQRFKRMVFRVTRGNNWTYMIDINIKLPEYDLTNKDSESKEITKTAFVVFFQGGEHDIVKNKLNKICEAFGASKFTLPDDSASYMQKILELDTQIGESGNVIHMTRAKIESLLEYFSNRFSSSAYCSYIEELKLFVAKEKQIYSNMNYLSTGNQIYTGFCWIPKQHEDIVRNALHQLQRNRPNIIGVELGEINRPENAKPPTYFLLNEFTAPFQEIVNTYGIPRYREVNPGLFAIPMFSFLFGVMFGDIGHGGVLLLFGMFLCFKNDAFRASKSPLVPLLEARYLILVLGMFACYAGFIYNDFFSIPFNLFGSCYNRVEGEEAAERLNDCVYPFGLDPKWYIASNELSFFNSLKMKLAVIIGVSQMTFGVFLKAINCIHYGAYVDFVFEFIPQLLFLSCTFGYMCLLVMYKWVIDWNEVGTDKAPSIITSMINMFLRAGSTQGAPLFDVTFQETLQFKLLIVALICVPTMLFVKPLILNFQHSQAHPKPKPAAPLKEKLLEHDEAEEGLLPQETHVEEASGDHGFGEIFVHQMIETIEFVLGAVSNTASYLRLWALSLAHSQLAKVFFEKTLGGGIRDGSFLQVFVGFFLFVNITFAVLMCMDLMECFLHALRLQWVEFQNKFYKADGYKFYPFSFIARMKEVAR